jgi:hypothetical protein
VTCLGWSGGWWWVNVTRGVLRVHRARERESVWGWLVLRATGCANQLTWHIVKLRKHLAAGLSLCACCVPPRLHQLDCTVV